MLSSRSIGLVAFDIQYNTIQYNTIQYNTISLADSLIHAQSAIFIHITLLLHSILLSCDIYYPFADGAVNTSDIEYEKMTVLHATKTFIIQQTCEIITRVSLIEQSDNADV